MFTIDYSRDASDGAWVRAHTESLIRLGVLVPVEPDKMWLCWSDKAGSWLRSHHNHNQTCNDRCGYVLIVEIGGSDDE